MFDAESMIKGKVFSEIHYFTHKRRVFDHMDKSKSKHELVLGLVFGLKSSIPDELLVEILIRLPNSGDACRCKSVSKKWRDLISTKYFISRFNDHHHNQLNESPDTFTLLFFMYWRLSSSTPEVPHPHVQHLESPDRPELALLKSYNGQSFIPPLGLLKSRNKCEYKKKKLKGAETEAVHVLNSCQDLLLCCRVRCYTYYIVNLLTRHWIVLPPVPSLDQGQQPCRKSIPRCGLICYQHDCCKFKVILVSIPAELKSPRFTIRIFCSESGEWTKLMVDWYPWTMRTEFSTSNMVPHNGMLHWLNGCSLVSLDLFNGDPDVKLSHTISLPDGIVYQPRFILGVCQGHLRVATYRHEALSFKGYVLIWKLEDYHKGLWQLLHRFHVRHGLDSNFRLMSFHPYISDVIIVWQEAFICHLNIKSGKLDAYLKLNFSYRVLDHTILQPFVLLHRWFPTPLPSPSPLVNNVDNTTLFSSSNFPHKFTNCGIFDVMN